jgi:two-component system response regulator FixJ
MAVVAKSPHLSREHCNGAGTQASPLVYLIDPDEAGRKHTGAQLKDCNLEFVAFRDSADFLAAIEPHRVGCVLTELQLGSSTAIHLVKQLRQRHLTLPVVLLTSRATVPLAVQSMKAGLLDVLEKPLEPFRLWDCVTRAFEIHTEDTNEALHRQSVKSRIAQLSRQELQVLQMLLDGEPNKRIACKLGVSPRTIVFRRKSVMEKMDAKSVAELACLVQCVTVESTPRNGTRNSLLDIHVATSLSDRGSELPSRK